MKIYPNLMLNFDYFFQKMIKANLNFILLIETCVRSHRMFFKLHKWSCYIPKKYQNKQTKTFINLLYHLRNDNQLIPTPLCTPIDWNLYTKNNNTVCILPKQKMKKKMCKKTWKNKTKKIERKLFTIILS